MGLPKVSFILGQGGSGRAAQGFDHYSSMIAYYSATTANSAYANIGNKIYTSILDAENDGVVNTFAEATPGASSQTITNAGATGDTDVITFTDWNGTIITIGNYTRISTDTTVTLVALGEVAAINALTYITGFSAAVVSAGNYTITAPKRFGIYPNSKSVTHTITGTVAVTNVAFASGTMSNLAVFHYQISEFFRENQLGILFFSIKLDTSTDTTAAFNTAMVTNISTIDALFNGMARQWLVYNPFRTFATSTLDALKTARTALFNAYIPAVFEYVGGFTGALSAQVNTRALLDDGVSACVAQSLSGVGFELTQTQQAVICQGGTVLGTLSVSAVSQSIGEVQAFNISDGSECEIVGFYDGTNFKNISDSLANQLHDFGYTFLRKFAGGYNGSYWNAGNCAITIASDYAYMEDCRTIDKAIRGVYQSIVSLLNAKNKVNPNGTLAAGPIANYTEKASSPLAQMVRDEDLSDFSVAVSTTHVISSDGTIPITINLQQVVIGRNITITIGFKATI